MKENKSSIRIDLLGSLLDKKASLGDDIKERHNHAKFARWAEIYKGRR